MLGLSAVDYHHDNGSVLTEANYGTGVYLSVDDIMLIFVEVDSAFLGEDVRAANCRIQCGKGCDYQNPSGSPTPLCPQQDTAAST